MISKIWQGRKTEKIEDRLRFTDLFDSGNVFPALKVKDSQKQILIITAGCLTISLRSKIVKDNTTTNAVLQILMWVHRLDYLI